MIDTSRLLNSPQNDLSAPNAATQLCATPATALVTAAPTELQQVVVALPTRKLMNLPHLHKTNCSRRFGSRKRRRDSLHMERRRDRRLPVADGGRGARLRRARIVSRLIRDGHVELFLRSTHLWLAGMLYTRLRCSLKSTSMKHTTFLPEANLSHL